MKCSVCGCKKFQIDGSHVNCWSCDKIMFKINTDQMEKLKRNAAATREVKN